MEEEKKAIELTVPMAIVIAGIFISAAIIISKGTPLPTKDTNVIEAVNPANINMRAVGPADHVRGSISAPVKIVVFSDPECPFCKRFHSTMLQVMNDYGKSKNVAWVYRNFPLDQLHPKARHESLALECANEIGGNDIFWAYLDRLMEVTPSNNQLDPSKLDEIATYVKLDTKKFGECLSSGKFAKRIQADIDDATSAGGRGTPYTVIVSPSGKKTPVDGAYPYESLKPMIDQALADVSPQVGK